MFKNNFNARPGALHFKHFTHRSYALFSCLGREVLICTLSVATLTNAKAEMETPFAKEAELAEKSARLKELNILLNMDQKDKTLLDDALEEDSPDKEKSRSVER